MQQTWHRGRSGASTGLHARGHLLRSLAGASAGEAATVGPTAAEVRLARKHARGGLAGAGDKDGAAHEGYDPYWSSTDSEGLKEEPPAALASLPEVAAEIEEYYLLIRDPRYEQTQ